MAEAGLESRHSGQNIYIFVLKPLEYATSQKQHIPHDIQDKSIMFQNVHILHSAEF